MGCHVSQPGARLEAEGGTHLQIDQETIRRRVALVARRSAAANDDLRAPQPAKYPARHGAKPQGPRIVTIRNQAAKRIHVVERDEGGAGSQGQRKLRALPHALRQSMSLQSR